MRYRNDITAEYVRSILDYDPETGVFRWKHRTDATPQWNSHYAGTIAGTNHWSGYTDIKIQKTSYRAHRIAWLWMTGEWPSEQIDHADLNKGNNKWCNLREATHSNNSMNSPIRKDNSSGYKNVEWHNKYKKWCVKIGIENKQVELFATHDLDVAAFIASEWRDKLHGKFARHE